MSIQNREKPEDEQSATGTGELHKQALAQGSTEAAYKKRYEDFLERIPVKPEKYKKM